MEDHVALVGISFDDRILIAMNETVSQSRDGSVIKLTWRSARRGKRQIETTTGLEEIEVVEPFEEDESHAFGRDADETARRLRFLEFYMPIFNGVRETSQGVR